MHMANEKMVMGTNVVAEVKGDKLIIEIDLKQDHGLSSSGKTKVIGTTSGTKKVMTPAGEIMIGVNVNKKPE